ncbi:MAG: hypothetical protein KF745_00650 [Phycisphaeraceae bacterium]|nr:hypothetical protein [Phycisphaeraceae bacterium]
MAAKNSGGREEGKPDAQGGKTAKKADLRSVSGGFAPKEVPVQTKAPPLTIKIKLDQDLKG